MTNAKKPGLRRGRALRAIAPLAAVSAVALTAPAPASAATCQGADADPASTNVKTVKRATVCLLNQQRRRHGLKKLKTNGRLSLASQRHSNDMAAQVLRARQLRRPHQRLATCTAPAPGASARTSPGAPATLATPSEIVSAWMHSPGHRHNILSGKFREIGIGVARGVPVRENYDGATYATDFGRRG